MKKMVILIIALMVLSVGFLGGCNESTNYGNKGHTNESENEQIDIEENIKGEWRVTKNEQNVYGETIKQTYIFIFYSDGETYKHTVGFYHMGTYYIVVDRLECYYPGGEHLDSFQNYYNIEMPDKDTLILTTIGEGTLTHEGRLEYTRVN